MGSFIAGDDNLEVAIVGGGIIGLVLATGLIRRHIKVRVYEQAQGFREIGAGIGFNTAAKGCMEMIDPAIIAALRIGGSVSVSAADENDPHDYLRWIDGYNVRRPDDPSYQKLYLKTDAGYKGIEGIRRDKFLEELEKIFQPGVIEFKKRLYNIMEGEGDEKLLLQFDDGTTAAVDAVIGCDGIWSKTREILLGKENAAGQPSYTHINFYGTLIPMEKAVSVLGEYKAKIFFNHIGPKANVLHYPVADGKLCNVTAFIHNPGKWAKDKPTTAIGYRKDIEAELENWNPAIRGLIDLFPEQLPMWAVFDMWEYPLPYYNRERICLAGDAAHASSPHHGAGAGMGVEDALCLSVLLSEVAMTLRQGKASKKEAISTAFEVYDGARRIRSQWLVNSSRRICDLHHQDDWADPTKWIKAETCLEEIKDRTFKIWDYNYNAMVKESVEKYNLIINRLYTERMRECSANVTSIAKVVSNESPIDDKFEVSFPTNGLFTDKSTKERSSTIESVVGESSQEGSLAVIVSTVELLQTELHTKGLVAPVPQFIEPLLNRSA